ncbi:MAG: flagellin [Sedimentisphaerales bacterium]|nr:flagellin [Sedimentisphaerales bacterium]
MLTIKNNIMSANATRHLNLSYDHLAQSVERLSSGLRINSAMDDAAGLAVRELMRADIAVLQQGSRNALDGISMLQTFEGAMGTIDDMLVRLKQLAEQAATGSYSSSQRTIMNNEFDELAAEIDRIVGSVEFNGNQLLNSATSTVSIQFGTATTDKIDITGNDLSSSALGLSTASISSAASARDALLTVSTAITTKDAARAAFGYKMNRVESTIAVINNQVENLTAAESRISDVDVATEMANITKTQVLAQAGVSMLSQANMMPRLALSLLG